MRQCFDLDEDKVVVKPIVTLPGPLLPSPLPYPHVNLPYPEVRPVPRPPVSQKVEYVLSFDWAPRTNGNNNLASSKGAVFIGNQKVADL